MNDHVIRPLGQLHEEIDGKIVLLGRKTGNYFALNEVGSAIWYALEHEVRVSDLCERIAGLFDIGLETVQDDVIGFLDELLGQDLVHVVAPPSRQSSRPALA